MQISFKTKQKVGPNINEGANMYLNGHNKVTPLFLQEVADNPYIDEKLKIDYLQLVTSINFSESYIDKNVVKNLAIISKSLTNKYQVKNLQKKYKKYKKYADLYENLVVDSVNLRSDIKKAQIYQELRNLPRDINENLICDIKNINEDNKAYKYVQIILKDDKDKDIKKLFPIAKLLTVNGTLDEVKLHILKDYINGKKNTDIKQYYKFAIKDEKEHDTNEEIYRIIPLAEIDVEQLDKVKSEVSIIKEHELIDNIEQTTLNKIYDKVIYSGDNKFIETIKDLINNRNTLEELKVIIPLIEAV